MPERANQGAVGKPAIRHLSASDADGGE